MKYPKLAIFCATALCATAISTGIFWYYNKSKKAKRSGMIQHTFREHQRSIAKKISALQTDFNKDPKLNENKRILIHEILSNMVAIDQEIRTLDIEAEMMDQTITKIMSNIDKTNLEYLLHLLKLTGNEWFTLSEFGEICDNNAWIIIQHSNPELQSKFLPILEKLATQGETRLQNFALLYDRVAMAEGKPQKYGTQFKVTSEADGLELYEVEDMQNLDKRRTAVGLPTMEEYVEILATSYKKPIKMSKIRP